jgi:hypothetical protein
MWVHPPVIQHGKPCTIPSKPATGMVREGADVYYAVVTSLAYRPSDNVLLVGTHGNGIFYTTGSLRSGGPGTGNPGNNGETLYAG